MKSDIHPQYSTQAQVKCACGNTWKTGSTLAEIEIEICDKCHPFFTGKDKKVDRRGRLEKFAKRQEKHQEKTKGKTEKKKRPTQKTRALTKSSNVTSTKKVASRAKAISKKV
jgi:large subunit ribosomal protein L31